MNSSPKHLTNAELSTRLRAMDGNGRYDVDLLLVREDGNGNVLGTYATNADAAWVHALDTGHGLELQPYDHYVSAVDSLGDSDYVYYAVQS